MPGVKLAGGSSAGWPAGFAIPVPVEIDEQRIGDVYPAFVLAVQGCPPLPDVPVVPPEVTVGQVSAASGQYLILGELVRPLQRRPARQMRPGVRHPRGWPASSNWRGPQLCRISLGDADTEDEMAEMQIQRAAAD